MKNTEFELIPKYIKALRSKFLVEYKNAARPRKQSLPYALGTIQPGYRTTWVPYNLGTIQPV